MDRLYDFPHRTTSVDVSRVVLISTSSERSNSHGDHRTTITINFVLDSGYKDCVIYTFDDKGCIGNREMTKANADTVIKTFKERVNKG